MQYGTTREMPQRRTPPRTRTLLPGHSIHHAYNCCSSLHSSYKTICPRTSHPHIFHQASLHTCNPEIANPILPPTSLVQVGFTAYIYFHRNRATQYGRVVYCWYLALWNGGARHRQGFAGTLCDTNPRQQTSSDRFATSH